VWKRHGPDVSYWRGTPSKIWEADTAGPGRTWDRPVCPAPDAPTSSPRLTLPEEAIRRARAILGS
jgi:hypothetical protein